MENFKLFSFEYRIFLRLSYFIHNIFNLTSAPPLLKNILQKKISNYALRKNERFLEPLIRNHYGESTFSYFFTKFLNNLYNTDIILTFLNFKKSVLKDIDSFFQIFVNIFSRFRLEYKVYTFRWNIKRKKKFFKLIFTVTCIKKIYIYVFVFLKS